VKIKKVVALGAAFGVLLAGVAIAAPANAEPVSNSYVLVGSDTLQDAANALANGTTITGSSVRVTAGGSTIGSYDAFGSAAIQTKSGGPFFGRPSGSGDGVKALSLSITGGSWTKNGLTKTITGQVDIARSSSGPSANPTGPLLYVPFSRDAVSYAYKFGAGVTSAAGIESLSAASLTAIYNGTQTSVGGVTVVPRLPQDGSGTRKFWVGAIGVSNTPAGVPDAATTTLAENDATQLTPAANTIQIVPFSAASWVAQSNGATGVNTVANSGGTLLGAIGGVAAFTGTGAALVPNAAFYSNATFGRDTYVVVEFARVDPTSATFDANLASLIDTANNKSLSNFGASPASSGAVKKKFGFLAPSVTTPQRANFG
jgi:hypothetical protein